MVITTLLLLIVIALLLFWNRFQKEAFEGKLGTIATMGDCDASAHLRLFGGKYPNNLPLHDYMSANSVRWEICFLKTHSIPSSPGTVRRLKKKIRAIIDPDLRTELWGALYTYAPPS